MHCGRRSLDELRINYKYTKICVNIVAHANYLYRINFIRIFVQIRNS